MTTTSQLSTAAAAALSGFGTGDADIGKPELPPARGLLARRQGVARHRGRRAEAHRRIEHLCVHGAEAAPAVGEERAEQHAASPAEEHLGLGASLAVASGLRRVGDADVKRTVRIGDVGGPVLAAEVAVAGARLVAVRGTRQLQLDTEVPAMT